MNDIVKVNYDNDRITVSARDLHDFLGVGTPYDKWFPRMCEYGFTDGVDYSTFLSDRVDGLPGKPRRDAQLTIDMVKELCMIQRSEKGKQARQYFIQLEKDWNTPEKVMARALVLAHKEIESVKQVNAVLMSQIEEQAPKVEFANKVSNTKDLINMGEMAKLLRDKNIDIGRNRLFSLLRSEGILMKSNIPYQSYIDKGYFEVKEAVKETDYGDKVFPTTYVTGKGQLFLCRKVQSVLQANGDMEVEE
nr:MAG TPA: KilAC domain protein [Caudoviricetes sp.]